MSAYEKVVRCIGGLHYSKSSVIMRGSIRNQFEMTCPKCGATVIIKEENDGSPMRVYDCVLCPECGESLYEKAIVGAFETEIKK